MGLYVIKVDSPKITAVLSNLQHPDLGQINISFPILPNEYDENIELLRELEIGSALQRDCRVDKMDSDYDILKRLEGQCVNVDELDYLAKRLDCLPPGGDVKFQGMAAKLNLSDITDFINLTFCCQRATVITDFFDLESIGKQHAQTMKENGTLLEGLEKADGEAIAQALIMFGNGTVTPYGVVFDNGIKLEQHYNGRIFPNYHHKDELLTVELATNGERTIQLSLPMPRAQFDRAIARAGISAPEQSAFQITECQLSDAFLPLLATGNCTLREINDVCQSIQALPLEDRAKLSAVIEFVKPIDICGIHQLAKNLDQFNFVPDVHTPEEYGWYMIEESDHPGYNVHPESPRDYEKYGSQWVVEEHGEFSALGYVSYHGTLPLEELIRGDSGGQCQGEQGQQMM